MGSTGSRPRLRKVAPCKSLQEEGAQPEPQWTLPALPVTVVPPSGSQGQRKTTLPPLKQEITLSTLSEPRLAGNLPPQHSNSSSIIHSHPPRRAQALQPLAPQIGHTSTASQIVMGRGCRDGDVQRFSTTGPTGHSGTSRMIQGGFLEAQTVLSQQARQRRQAQLRQAREQRRHKVVYTVNEGNQRLKLVKRPTQSDIFWDETTGKRLDPSCLLDSESLSQLCPERWSNQPRKQPGCRGEDRIQRVQAQGQTEQPGQRGLSLDKSCLWTTERQIRSGKDRGKTQWWPELARNCQTEHVTDASGTIYWSSNTYSTNLQSKQN